MPVYVVTTADGQKHRVTTRNEATQEELQAAVDGSSAPKQGWWGSAPKQQPKSTLRQLGDSFVNNVAGAAQGFLSLPDAFIEAGAGGMRMLNTAVGVPSEYLANAMGNKRGAEAMRRDRLAQDRALAEPVTFGRLIEKAAPTPQDGNGQWARFGSQMLGAMMLPVGPKATPPTKLPTRSPPKSTPPRVIPDAQEVIATGRKANVPVMTSDVRPPRTAMGEWLRGRAEQIPFAGTGGPRAAQQEARQEAVKGLLTQFGGQTERALLDDGIRPIENIAQNLTKTRGNAIGKLSAQKQGVISRLSQPGDVVPVDRTVSAIDDQIAALTQRGTPAANAAADTLRGYREALQGKTLDQLEAIRQDELANVFKGGNTLADVKAVGEKALRSIYDPLRAEMGTFIRQRGGKESLSAWQKANAQLSDMAGELGSTRLKGVLRTADLTPENVQRMLFSQSRSDVARLMGNLDRNGQAQARSAILQRAFDRAVSPDGGLSVEKFVGNIKALEPSITGAFKGADLDHVRGLTRLLEATRRASEAGVMPKNGAQNTPIAVLAGMLSVLGPTATAVVGGIPGVLARAYESAPVRDALIRAARVKPGTRSEAMIMERAAKALALSMQDDFAKEANDNLTRPLALPSAANPEESRQYGQQ